PPRPPPVTARHTGTGFDQKELDRVFKLLAARETPQSPFRERIKSNEPAHWVRPELVAQVRFTEWTADRKLRHPVYLGLRDDKRANEVTAPHGKVARRAAHEPAPSARAARTAGGDDGRRRLKPAITKPAKETASVVEQLRTLEDARKDGTIELP